MPLTKKKWLIFFVIAILGGISFAIYTFIASQNELRLAENYNTQFLQLYEKGEFQKALPFAAKAFNIRMRKLGIYNTDTLKSPKLWLCSYCFSKKVRNFGKNN